MLSVQDRLSFTTCLPGSALVVIGVIGVMYYHKMVCVLPLLLGMVMVCLGLLVSAGVINVEDAENNKRSGGV